MLAANKRFAQMISGSLPSSIGATNSSGTNGTGGSAVAPWVGNNTDRQPGRKTVDIRLSKRFDVGGRRNTEALWEVFNLFDSINYSTFSNTAFSIPTGGATYNPATNVATVNLRRDAAHLVARSASTNLWGPRDMQFGLKFRW